MSSNPKDLYLLWVQRKKWIQKKGPMSQACDFLILFISYLVLVDLVSRTLSAPAKSSHDLQVNLIDRKFRSSRKTWQNLHSIFTLRGGTTDHTTFKPNTAVDWLHELVFDNLYWRDFLVSLRMDYLSWPCLNSIRSQFLAVPQNTLLSQEGQDKKNHSYVEMPGECLSRKRVWGYSGYCVLLL